MPRQFTPLARVLDAIADREGIDPAHIRRFPDLLAEAGLEAEDLDNELATEARQCGYAELNVIATRHDAIVSHWW